MPRVVGCLFFCLGILFLWQGRPARGRRRETFRILLAFAMLGALASCIFAAYPVPLEDAMRFCVWSGLIVASSSQIMLVLFAFASGGHVAELAARHAPERDVLVVLAALYALIAGIVTALVA